MGGALNNMREKKCCYAACIGTSCGFMTLWSIILLVGGSLISLNIVARNTASINKYLLDPLEGRRTSDLAKPETVDDINDLLVNALQDYDPLPGMPLEEKHSDRHSIFFCKVTTQASAPPSSRQPASWFMRPQWSLLDPTTWTPPSDWTDVDSWERTPEMSLTIKLHTKLEYVASRIVMYARPDRTSEQPGNHTWQIMVCRGAGGTMASGSAMLFL